MQPVELIVKVYPNEKLAGKVLRDLEHLQGKDALRLFSAAAIEKSASGSTHVHESDDVHAGRGALVGALTGALVGLVGGPVGAVLGAAAGAATGGLTASQVDQGFSHAFLKELKAALQPGTSVILVLVETQWVRRVVEELSLSPGRLLRGVVKAGLAEKLRQS